MSHQEHVLSSSSHTHFYLHVPNLTGSPLQEVAETVSANPVSPFMICDLANLSGEKGLRWQYLFSRFEMPEASAAAVSGIFVFAYTRQFGFYNVVFL